MKINHIFYAVMVAAIWGLNFVVVKVGLSEMPPFLYGSARFVVALLPLLWFIPGVCRRIFYKRFGFASFGIRPPSSVPFSQNRVFGIFNPPRHIEKPPVSWLLILGIGLTLGVAKFGFMFWGIHVGMSAGLASLLLQSQAFFTTVLSVLFLKDKIRLNQLLGMIIAFAGMAVIGTNLHEGSTALGFLMILAAALSWAFCNILFKLAGNVNMFSLVLWTSLIPPLPMYTLSYIFEGPSALPNMLSGMTAVGWACLLFTACGSTWIGATIWGILLRTYDASLVAPYSLLIPVFGISFGHILLGEQFKPITYIACGLVFLGLLVNQWRFGKLKPLSSKIVATPTPVEQAA